LLAAPLLAVPAVLRSSAILSQNGASGSSARLTLAASRSRACCRKHTTMLMNTVNL
jgi:hypothetical protein